MRQIETQLLQELEKFTNFVRARVGDPHLVADVVQDSLLKAIKAADQLRDDESVTAWFYRILRRSIIDLYRRRATNQAALERLERELDSPPDAEEERIACGCIETLNHAQSRRCPPEQVGGALGLTVNNLRVRHHRARNQLRERLEQTCRICAEHGCLDWTCKD